MDRLSRRWVPEPSWIVRSFLTENPSLCCRRGKIRFVHQSCKPISRPLSFISIKVNLRTSDQCRFFSKNYLQCRPRVHQSVTTIVLVLSVTVYNDPKNSFLFFLVKKWWQVESRSYASPLHTYRTLFEKSRTLYQVKFLRYTQKKKLTSYLIKFLLMKRKYS